MPKIVASELILPVFVLRRKGEHIISRGIYLPKLVSEILSEPVAFCVESIDSSTRTLVLRGLSREEYKRYKEGGV